MANGRIARVRCDTYTQIRTPYNPHVARPIHLRLDSSQPTPFGWTYIANSPTLLLRCDPKTHVCTLLNVGTDVRPPSPNEVLQSWNNPTDALDWMEQHARTLPPTSQARWIGFLSYDLGRIFEHLPSTATDDLTLPLFEFAFCDHPLTREAHDALPSPGSEDREGEGSEYQTEELAAGQSGITAQPKWSRHPATDMRSADCSSSR